MLFTLGISLASLLSSYYFLNFAQIWDRRLTEIQERLKEVSEKFEGRGMGARRFLMKGVMGGFLRLQNIVG